MPTLNWIGKEAVVKHHKAVPFRLLESVPALSCGPADSGNLIVQGDNLHARYRMPEFWRRVERAMPDFAQRKVWLSEHGIDVEGV